MTHPRTGCYQASWAWPGLAGPPPLETGGHFVCRKLQEKERVKNHQIPVKGYFLNPIETIVAFMRRAGDRIPFGTMGAYLRQKQRLYSDSRNFFVLSPLVLRVVSFESVYSALSDDVWYCSGWYWKFLRNIDLKSRHAKCVRSAWPECIDSVARCGSSITCASMELARCGSSSTCARYGATIFPVCLAFQGRKISLILSSFSFWRKNHTNQR